MMTIVTISKEESLATLVFLEWLKSYVMLWKLKETPIPWPKGTNEHDLDGLINKYKEVAK